MMDTFNFDDFINKQYERRTEDVVLKSFGGDNKEVVFTVQNLTSEDLAEADFAVEKNRSLSALIDLTVKASCTQKTTEQIEAIKALLGIDEKTHDSLVKKYVVFEKGCKTPAPSTRQQVVKFAMVYPVEFTILCNKIYELTAKGGIEKKKL